MGKEDGKKDMEGTKDISLSQKLQFQQKILYDKIEGENSN
jgi:hypothetical protein